MAEIKDELIAALLDCPTIEEFDRREALVRQLPADVRRSLKTTNVPRIDVVQLVNACLNYPDGLSHLIEQLRFFEGDSLPMARVEAVWRRMPAEMTGSNQPAPRATQSTTSMPVTQATTKGPDDVNRPAGTSEPPAPSAPSAFAYDVFVSYAHADGDWVWSWLVPRLKAAGLAVCTDRESFDVGVPSLINMENAVIQSRQTVLVLTPHYVGREWPLFEQILTQSQDPMGLRQRTLPVLRVTCNLPPRIAMLTYVDAREGADLEVEFARLLRAIRGARSLTGPTTAGDASDTPMQGQAKLPPNPFTETLAVQDPQRFIGRTAELRRLRTLLEGGSVSLIGEPKIGKSSLLWQLKVTWPGTVIGPIDVQGLVSRRDFYARLAEELHAAGTAWRDVRSALLHAEVVLLLDELDAHGAQVVTYEDLGRLRSVCGENRGCHIVTVSRRPLKELYPDAGRGSPPYNFLSPLTLGPLTDAEAQRLLAHPWSPQVPAFAPDATQQLLALAGRHPFWLQRAAFHRYEAQLDPEYAWEAAFDIDRENLQ